MDKKYGIACLPEALLPWYKKNMRALPWRQDKDPYHIWVSEIMLQQTRVEAVKGYYTRFIGELPTVAALADCDDERLQKLWEGLGYYTRVRNLKKAAMQVMSLYNGVFPMVYEKILALPGIGAYTAGAICSIAFDQPVPAVDGNVLRVIARLTDDDTPVDTPAYKKSVQQRLKEIYPANAGDFTQALMELGATVCGPNRLPNCGCCPCREICMGYRNKRAGELPVRLPKRQRRREERTVFILSCGDQIALRKRPARGLLAGLWELPNVPGKLNTADALEQVEKYGLKPSGIHAEVERKHIFTHIEWDMRGVYAEVAEHGGDFLWLSADEIRSAAALPTAFRLFLTEGSPPVSSGNLRKKQNNV